MHTFNTPQIGQARAYNQHGRRGPSSNGRSPLRNEGACIGEYSALKSFTQPCIIPAGKRLQKCAPLHHRNVDRSRGARVGWHVRLCNAQWTCPGGECARTVCGVLVEYFDFIGAQQALRGELQKRRHNREQSMASGGTNTPRLCLCFHTALKQSA